MSSKEGSNPFYSISLDGEAIIGHEQQTVGGGFVDVKGAGTFDTPIGRVDVDFTEYEYNRHKRDGGLDGIVVVSGEGLRRPLRGRSLDEINHPEAITGVHRVYTGRRAHGCLTIGGGKVLEVNLIVGFPTLNLIASESHLR